MNYVVKKNVETIYFAGDTNYSFSRTDLILLVLLEGLKNEAQQMV